MNIEEKPTGTERPIAAVLRSRLANPGVEFAIFCVLSVLAYFIPFNIGLIVSLAIMQTYLALRGKSAFIRLFFVASIAVLTIIVFILPLFPGIPAAETKDAQLLDSLRGNPFASGLMHACAGAAALGFLFVNLFERKGLRFVFKLLIMTAVTSVLGLFAIYWIRRDANLTRLALGFFEDVLDAISVALSISPAPASQESLGYLLEVYVFSTFSSSTFAFVSLSWWLGLFVARRYFKVNVPQLELVRFRIQDAFVWLLIGMLGLFLAGIVMDLGIVVIVSVNLLFIVLCVFSVQGMGVVNFYILRSPVFSQMSRFLPFFLLIVFVTSSPILPLLWLFLAGLGISEIWLRYRTRIVRNGDSG